MEKHDKKLSLVEALQLRQPLEIISFLQDKGLLQATRTCPNGCKQMTLQPRPDVQDQYGWRCSQCRKRISLRSGTFFERSGTSFQVILQLIFHWAIQTRQSDQPTFIKVSRPTVSAFQQEPWFNRLQGFRQIRNQARWPEQSGWNRRNFIYQSETSQRQGPQATASLHFRALREREQVVLFHDRSQTRRENFTQCHLPASNQTNEEIKKRKFTYKSMKGCSFKQE